MSFRPARRASVAAALALVVATAAAQRPVVEFKVKERKASIEHGVPNAGKHGLDELKVGDSWRMGSNNASVFATDLPILSGAALLAPGSYRVDVARPGEKDLSLRLSTAAAALGLGGASVDLPGTVGKLDKPAKKLAVQFTAAGKDEPHAKPAKVVVEFGADKLEVPMTVVGFKASKAGDWGVDVFTYPKDVLEKRLADGFPTPLAAVRKPDPNDGKKTLAYNVVAAKGGVKLVPWMSAPTADRGFAPPTEPAADAIREGKAEWTAAAKPTAALELEKAEFKKGEGFTFRLTVGDQAGVLTLPDPLAPPKKS